jgi:hypothetical protein
MAKTSLQNGSRRAELIHVKFRTPYESAQALIRAAIALRQHSRLEESFHFTKRAFALGERMGNLWIQAAALAELGRLHSNRGDRTLARRDWHRAYTIFKTLDAHEKCARLQILMAYDLRLSGHLNPAVSLYKKILKSAVKHELTEIKALVYGQMGIVLRELDRNGEAEACFERSIKAGQESSYWPVVYKSMLGLSELLVLKRRYLKADEYYNKAKAWYENSGERDGGLIEIVAAKSALHTGRTKEAKEILFSHYYRVQNGLQKAMIAEQLVNVALSEGDQENAKRYYHCALKLFYENRAPGWSRRLRKKNYFGHAE